HGWLDGAETLVEKRMSATAHRSTVEVARELSVNCSASDLVRLDQTILEKLALHIKQRADFSEYERSKWDDARFWNVEDSPQKRSQYFTIGNAINFRFWKLVDGRTQPAAGWIDGEKFVGSMYLWRSLRRSLRQGSLPILDARFL